MDENKKPLIVRQRIFPKEEEVGGWATAAAASLVPLLLLSGSLFGPVCLCRAVVVTRLLCCVVLCCTSFPDLSSLFVSSRRISGFLVVDKPLRDGSIDEGRRGQELSGVKGHCGSLPPDRTVNNLCVCVLERFKRAPAPVTDQSTAQKPWTSPLHLHLTPRPPSLPPPLCTPPPPLPCLPPPLVCATFHPLILLLFLSSSIPRSSMLRWGFCLISLPVRPIARSARPTLAPRRGGARPRRPARPPRPARRVERRGEGDLF